MSLADNIEVLTHSSIRIGGKCILYIDPYQVQSEPHDADIILITHSHYDHYSPEDIARVRKQDTAIVVPMGMEQEAAAVKGPGSRIYALKPGTIKEIFDIMIETVPAYNNRKSFHPKKNGWLGYLLHVNGDRIYIAGDTDITKENQRIQCDVALVPIGGTYTMDAAEAAKLVNKIKPRIAIPTHYGSVVGTREDEEVFRSHVASDIKVQIKMQMYA